MRVRLSEDQLIGMEENSAGLDASGGKASGEWGRIMDVCNLLISSTYQEKKEESNCCQMRDNKRS